MLDKHWTFSLCRFNEDGGDGDNGGAGDGAADGNGGGEGGSANGGAGDGTKSAEELAAEVEKWKKLSRQNEAAAKANADKAKKFDAAEAANLTELEREKARADAAEQRAQQRTERAVLAEVRSLADDFTDREDAVAHLSRQEGGLARFVGEDGEIDTAAIETALAEVLTKKAHLKKAASGQQQQDRGLGSRGGGGPTDFRTADKATVNAEMARHGIRPRST